MQNSQDSCAASFLVAWNKGGRTLVRSVVPHGCAGATPGGVRFSCSSAALTATNCLVTRVSTLSVALMLGVIRLSTGNAGSGSTNCARTHGAL